jgi:PDZ domain
MKRYLPITLAVLSVIGVACAHADEQDRALPRASVGQDTEQRLRDELRSVLLRLAETGALGQRPVDATLSLNEPARRVNDLGMVVDSSNVAVDGLPVLATTPGSSAERMGLQPGDRVLAVNGESLRGLGADERGRARAAAQLRERVERLADGAALKLDIQRDGRSLSLDGAVASVYLPALRMELGEGLATAAVAGTRSDSGCGRISVFHIAPRSQHLYPAVIISLDGHTPGTAGQQTYRVAAGPHKLVVAEAIDSRDLSLSAAALSRRSAYKELSVDLAPGTTAMIAARLNPDQVGKSPAAAYWDPVVWKQIDEACH